MSDQVKKLREEAAGCRQVIELDQAVIAAVLEKTGAVTVDRESLSRHLRERTQVRAAFRPETGSYRLWLEGGDAGV